MGVLAGSLVGLTMLQYPSKEEEAEL